MTRDHKTFGLSKDFALTNETVVRFREQSSDPQFLSHFVNDSERAVAFLSALTEGCADWQDCLAETLCKPDVVFDLAQAGNVDAIWSMILQFSSIKRQLTVLQAPEVAFILSKNGKADAVRKLMLNFPDPEQRLSICRVPYAVFGMAKYGNTQQTLSLIKAFPEATHQATVLSVSHVVYGLVDNLDAVGNHNLLDMIQGLTKDQQAEVLASELAVLGLVKNGKLDRVLNWMRGFSKPQLERLRNAAYVVPILSENANPRDIEFFLDGLPEKRDVRSRKERLAAYRSGRRHLH